MQSLAWLPLMQFDMLACNINIRRTCVWPCTYYSSEQFWPFTFSCKQKCSSKHFVGQHAGVTLNPVFCEASRIGLISLQLQTWLVAQLYCDYTKLGSQGSAKTEQGAESVHTELRSKSFGPLGFEIIFLETCKEIMYTRSLFWETSLFSSGLQDL